jgi:rSAM/selenodomain-associated transferase 1
MNVDLLVFAKAPVPGRCKTRLTPPLTPQAAAALAAAMLDDTFAAVCGCRAAGRLLVLDGEAGPWVPAGFRVIPQRGHGQAARLAAAFGDAFALSGRPALLIGMDTPQVTAELLDACITRLGTPGVHAVLGPAADGGWWTIGLRRPDPRVFEGVPMSTSATGELQRRRLDALGLRCAALPVLADVDTIDDAHAVADEVPESACARVLRRVRPRVLASGRNGVTSGRGP